MAISVVLAVGGVGDELVDKIKARIPNVKIGPGTDPSAEMGPLITKVHRDKVVSYLDSARADGATVVVDGSSFTPPAGHEEGFFCGVSLIDDVKPGMAVYDDEIFGPVLSVVRVDTYDDGLKLINDNQYGNGTALFTRDGGLAREFQHDCLVGMVGINVPIPVPVAYYSFGGWKASLFGDRHMYGPEGVDFFTRTKAVTSRWPDPRQSSVDLGFPKNH
jgi:malonate-semialdehyde dehydrogenase (acetylating) / methylmalonate-semialdehyde dehydrogenase